MSIGDLLADVRHSSRMFWKSPGFALAAVAALALGIGANTAIFSIVNAVLLKPLPFPDAGRLVAFQTTTPQGAFGVASPAKFQHWREQTSVVEKVSAFRSNVVNFTGGGVPEQLHAEQVSADFFALFGARVYQGRTFTEAEDSPGGERVVVLSWGLWVRRFGSDPHIIGRTLSLSGDSYTIVGVIDRGFDFGDIETPPEIYIPFQLDPHTSDQGHYFRASGRLMPGVSLEQAVARLKLSAEAYKKKFPNALQNDQAFSAQLMTDQIVGGVRTTLLVLLGAVTLVLLIACANVANLLLARAAGRRREIAVRAAIGAGRGRLMRQLLTESLLLSLAGGLVGLALGTLGIRALLAVNTAGLPRVGDNGSVVAMDWRVALFTLLVSLATGLIFGLVPALQASQADLTATLKESAGRSGTGFRQNKTRSTLVVIEVALALVLVIGSALLVRTAVALRTVEPGFDPTNVLTMRMSMTGSQYLKSEGVEQAVREGVARMRAVPGVLLASATCCVPLEGGYGLPFVIVGRPLDNGPFHGGGGWTTVSSGYFEVFRIPVLRGRAFNANDTSTSTPVVVINEAMAKQYWPKGDPLSHRLIIGRGVMKEFAGEPERQIIGVVGDTRGSLDQDPGPIMYIPQPQVPDAANALNVNISPMAWVVRTAVAPYSLVGQVREALRQATGLPVSDVRTMDDVVSRSVSRQRFNMWLMTAFGLSALALAAIGIYGLIAYSVEQRTQEIGIRLALGAETRQVRRMVVVQGMRLAIIGVVVGVAGAAGFAKALSSFLYGVTTWDPLTFVAAPIALGLVALVATWVPARRASLVDPIDALRCE